MSIASATRPKTSSPSKPVILLVDDEENILHALRRSLNRMEVQVITASSGSDALYILENTEVDLMISDMRMPEMDGAELLSIVAQQSPHTVRFLLTGYSDMESTARAINDGKIHQYLTKPWDDKHLRGLIEESLHTRLLEVRNERLKTELAERNRQLQTLNHSLEEKVKSRTHEVELQARVIEHAFNDLQKSYSHVIKLASSLAGLRDPGAAAASSLRGKLATAIAMALDLSARDVRDIRDAALLADVGQISLSDELLSKPLAQYTGQDMEHYARLPEVAEAALMGIPGMALAARLVRSQFERFDGTGYPDHLAGENIPAGARIVAIVRDYCDLMRGRVTGEPLSAEQASSEILNRAASHYDPELVAIFQKVSGEYADDIAQAQADVTSVNALKPGMVLTQDLYSERGMILLTAGNELTSEFIAKLKTMEAWAAAPFRLHVTESITADDVSGDET